MTVALPPGYTLTDDRARIDAHAAHAYLTRSYWSPGISADVVRRAIENSHCVAIRHDRAQVAMARLITDWATFAYLADVYVLEDHRGRGLSKAMLAHLHADPRLAGLRRWLLTTQDAQGLYERFGWAVYAHPERMMEKRGEAA